MHRCFVKIYSVDAKPDALGGPDVSKHSAVAADIRLRKIEETAQAKYGNAWIGGSAWR